MKSVPIMLLLAAVVSCERESEAPPAPPGLAPLTLPVASNGVADKGEYPDGRVILNVDAKGFVLWMGKKVTLDQLSAGLGNLKDKYHLKMRGAGKSYLEEHPGGGMTSKLAVLLRVDKETPWQHVHWLITIVCEQKLYRLQLAVSRVADRAYTREEAVRLGANWVDRAPPEKPRLAAKVDVLLPRDTSEGRETPGIRAAVHIVARKEIAARWGPDDLPVCKPTAFRYRIGDRTVDSLEHVGKWIGDALIAVRGAPGTRLVGEIQAGDKVPFKEVVAVLNQFHARGVKQVDFWGMSIPDQEQRKLPCLPYPLKNYATPD